MSAKPKTAAVDTPFIVRPPATFVADHPGGPQMKHLVGEYSEVTGLDSKKEYPEWNIAGRPLLGVGISGSENARGAR